MGIGKQSIAVVNNNKRKSEVNNTINYSNCENNIFQHVSDMNLEVQTNPIINY